MKLNSFLIRICSKNNTAGLILGVMLLLPGFLSFNKPFSPPLSAPQLIVENEKKRDIAVIFDFNNVLFKIPTRNAIKKLGFFNGLKYLKLWGTNSEKATERIFSFLCLLRNEELIRIDEKNPFKIFSPSHQKWILPTIMQEWMRGTISTKEIVKEISFAMDHSKRDFFVNKSERIIFKKMFEIFFDLETRVKLYEPIKEGIKLLKFCKKKGYKTLILSNIDTELIPELAKKYPDIFSLFDEIVLSAEVHMLKPEREFYEYTLNTFKLTPATTCFIDDEPINVESARILGIHSFLFEESTSSKKLFNKICICTPEKRYRENQSSSCTA